MLRSDELGFLLLKTQKVQKDLGSWQPIRLQMSDGKFVVFSGVKVDSGRTVGGRHVDLVACVMERDQAQKLMENSIQVMVGAGLLPESQSTHYSLQTYVVFVELIYPF